jgi:phosphopantothenoylcysteine decarboxylase/phosphopantothenate--cysteine ligase
MASVAESVVTSKRILLIIGGGIAAYKCLDLARRLGERGIGVRCVMTRAAQEFITPLSVGAITGERVFSDLFNLEEEREIGHIRLSREADLIVVAPATADLLAKMAGGHADDLASAVLIATDKPVLAAPAMNPRMWRHPATRRNVAQLMADGINFIGPNVGEMAEPNEAGPGRMAEPLEVAAAIEKLLEARKSRQFRARADPARRGGLEQSGRPADSLAGRHVLVTSGPTREPIDPVRYIANRSSGKQGHAIASAAARAGARVTLVTGPVDLPPPAGVDVVQVETASEMLAAVLAALPADAAICAAAVADWRVAEAAAEKIKKAGRGVPKLTLVENPDILRRLAMPGKGRPALVIGFAAETENVVEHAKKKRKAKGCDWIVANDVSVGTGVMGGERNRVHLITAEGVESWPEMDKRAVGERLVARAGAELARIAADV